MMTLKRNPELYERCTICNDPMTGINKRRLGEKEIRIKCEACGGNTTRYHVNDPNPLQTKREKSDG